MEGRYSRLLRSRSSTPADNVRLLHRPLNKLAGGPFAIKLEALGKIHWDNNAGYNL
jgi:hypothetical protein